MPAAAWLIRKYQGSTAHWTWSWLYRNAWTTWCLAFSFPHGGIACMSRRSHPVRTESHRCCHCITMIHRLVMRHAWHSFFHEKLLLWKCSQDHVMEGQHGEKCHSLYMHIESGWSTWHCRGTEKGCVSHRAQWWWAGCSHLWLAKGMWIPESWNPWQAMLHENLLARHFLFVHVSCCWSKWCFKFWSTSFHSI